MRIRLAVLSFLVSLALLFGLSLDPIFSQETKRFRYGTTISAVNLPVWVARESRLFTKYGLNPEVIMIQAGALTTMGILSGELQFSGAGAASVLAARIKGADITLLACPADSDIVYLIARPEIKGAAGERAYVKWLRQKDPALVKKAVEAYANLFKPIPRVSDRGIKAVLEDLSLSTPVPKELIDRPDYFRDNGPLEKLVSDGWIEQISK